MRNLQHSSVIRCDVDTFWRLFTNDTYQRTLYVEGLGFADLVVLERSEVGRRARITPKFPFPQAVARMFGDNFSYEEISTFDRARSEWCWKMVPTRMANQLDATGVVRVQPLPDGTCQRSDSARLDARVFGIGKLVEMAVGSEISKAWSLEEGFMNRWFQEHAVLPQASDTPARPTQRDDFARVPS